MELKGKVVNFLGDSITMGAGVSEPNNIYYKRIEKAFGLKKANGYGIGGTRIAKQTIPSLDYPPKDKWFNSRVEEMDKDADIVVIFGGTNDWGHGDAKVGTFDDRDEYTFYGALHTLYENVINKYPGKPIVVITPLHRENDTDLHDKGDRKMKLQDYVDIIKEVARYYSIPVCDMFSISGLQPQVSIIKEKFIPDGLHPNDDGHEILAERIGNFLTNL